MIKKLMALVLGVLLLGSVAYAQTTEKSLTFEWEQEISDDFGKWTLYKSSTSGGPYEFVTDIPYEETMTEPYTTSTVLIVPSGSETTMYFVLTASDLSENESGYSNEAVHTFDFESPTIPIEFTIKVQAQ